MIDFKAAIFDLDGTLLDSMWVWEKVDDVFSAKRGLITPDDYFSTVAGMNMRQVAEYTKELFSLPNTVEEIMDEWNELAKHEYSRNVRLKPGAKKYLSHLKENGIKLSTATSLPPILSVPALKNNGIYEIFDTYCFAEETNAGKNSPDIFILAAKKLGVEPKDCIVFEDIPQGIASAKSLGMKVIGIHDKYSKSDEEKIRAIADGYIYDFNEINPPAGESA